MAKIGFGDIVAMAKSGWTPEAVNNMLDRFESMNEKQEKEEQSHEDDSDSHEDSHKSQEDERDSHEDEKDARIKELEEQLAAAQKHNRQQDNSGGEQKSLDNMVDDIFQEFFN